MMMRATTRSPSSLDDKPGERLDVAQFARQRRVRRDEAHAQVGRERLGEAADVDHAPPVIEACEPHRMPALQIAVDVVFEDHEIVARGELEHARRHRRAHARARGVVRHGIEDEQLGPFARQQAFERGDIRAVDAARHTDDARTECREAREHHEPGRDLRRTPGRPGARNRRATRSMASVAPALVTICSGATTMPACASRVLSASRSGR